MMQIVYYSNKSQILNEIQLIPGDKKIITPSPAKADGLRASIKQFIQCDVVTIAKFTSELISLLWPPDAISLVKRKADLLLIFGILKNRYLSELGFEQFIQAYNLFSDLRSFTLNEDALSSIMDEWPEEIRRAVNLFWRLLELTGDMDEHSAYQKLSESLRSTEEKMELKKSYIFWGFKHLNGQQVDLIKALSIRYSVIIPLPFALKEKLKRSDWPTWLIESKVSEKYLPNLDHIPKANWLKINSRELSLSLKSIIKTGDQVILGVSKLDPTLLDIVPNNKISFKIPHQLLHSELDQLAAELRAKFQEEQDLNKLEELIQFKRSQTVLELGGKGNYKMLKALDLYLEVLTSIRELTDDLLKVDRFLLKLLQEVVTLNQPRISFVSMLQQDVDVELKDMSSIEELKLDNRVLLCLDERFDEIQGVGQHYNESVQRALASLGPLKRSELELQFLRWEFLELLQLADVTVLMSDSLLKHSIIWQKLFTGVELVPLAMGHISKSKKITDVMKIKIKRKFSGNLSASKFQSYIDCPRKFYFNYVDELIPKINLKQDFDALTAGTVLHEILEKFYANKSDIKFLPKITCEVMDFYIKKEALILPHESYLKHQLIFNQRAENGINFLQKLSDHFGGKIEWKMEIDFSINGASLTKGKIDCFGKSENILFLFDFKSTKFSTSSNKEVESFESIQLWTYVCAAAEIFKDFKDLDVVMGFISLDNPSESTLLFSDKSLADDFKLSKISRHYFFKEPFREVFDRANFRLETLARDIKQEVSFPARPRKEGVCHFCDWNKVCIKSESINE